MRSYRKYDEDFKKSLVNLYHSGKTQTSLCKEYGVSSSALTKWIKAYSEIKIDEDTILTAKQVRELQKRNALLEEENLILKKQLPYLRHTRRKTECDTYSASST